jgi:hypothetical protein
MEPGKDRVRLEEEHEDRAGDLVRHGKNVRLQKVSDTAGRDARGRLAFKAATALISWGEGMAKFDKTRLIYIRIL